MKFKNSSQRKAVMARLNPMFRKYKPYKTVSTKNPELKKVSNGMVMYKGELYGAKDDLRYNPKRVRLIRLNPTIPIKDKRRNIKHLRKHHPSEDADKDGVPNKTDCQPLNPKKQGFIHDAVAGIGRGVGYVAGEVVAGARDIPQEYKRQRKLTMKKEKELEARRDKMSASQRLKLERDIKRLKSETRNIENQIKKEERK